MLGFGKSSFRHRRNHQTEIAEYDEALNYEWVLAPEPETEFLQDVEGMILAAGDVVRHVDDGSYGQIVNVDFSPYFGEFSIMAYVIWEDGSADWFAGHTLILA